MKLTTRIDAEFVVTAENLEQRLEQLDALAEQHGGLVTAGGCGGGIYDAEITFNSPESAVAFAAAFIALGWESPSVEQLLNHPLSEITNAPGYSGHQGSIKPPATPLNAPQIDQSTAGDIEQGGK